VGDRSDSEKVAFDQLRMNPMIAPMTKPMLNGNTPITRAPW
jgi:hypothetical protein